MLQVSALLRLVGRWWTTSGSDAANLVAFTVAVALIYWVVIPRALRSFFLLVVSLLFLALSGTSFWFLGLLILMGLMTHASAAAGSNTVPRSAGLDIASLAYGIVALLIVVVEALLPKGSLELSAGQLWGLVLVALMALGSVLLAVHEQPSPLASLRGWMAHVRSRERMRTLSPFDGLRWLVSIGLMVVLVALTLALTFTSFRGPRLQPIQPADAALAGALFVLAALTLRSVQRSDHPHSRRVLAYVTIGGFLLSFSVLKTSGLPFPGLITWVGYSYYAFRMLHVVVDGLNDLPSSASPVEVLTYGLFFPAALSGPIDRLPHFLAELRSAGRSLTSQHALIGVTRIVVGAAKIFFLADLLLSRIALGQPSDLPPTIFFRWIQLYAYSLYLFFDFSGFIDIALGTGLLLGFSLPENFDRPYLKSSITEFWRSWHITLTNWLRAYIFLPFSRWALRTRLSRYPDLVVFCAQMLTMILVGLWHGYALHYALWGAWNGLGLFAHKVFSDRTRGFWLGLRDHPWADRLVRACGVVLTFHFVTLGWIFFVIVDPAAGFRFLLSLFGMS